MALLICFMNLYFRVTLRKKMEKEKKKRIPLMNEDSLMEFEAKITHYYVMNVS